MFFLYVLVYYNYFLDFIKALFKDRLVGEIKIRKSRNYSKLLC